MEPQLPDGTNDGKLMRTVYICRYSSFSHRITSFETFKSEEAFEQMDVKSSNDDKIYIKDRHHYL